MENGRLEQPDLERRREDDAAVGTSVEGGRGRIAVPRDDDQAGGFFPPLDQGVVEAGPIEAVQQVVAKLIRADSGGDDR